MHVDPQTLSDRDAYRLMISCIVPRPIALVSSISTDGIANAAPFSFFNGFDSSPALLTVAIGKKYANGKPVNKDTLNNILATRQFVVNVVTEAMAESMVQCSANYPPEISELPAAGFSALPSLKIRPPRIAESPVHLECELRQTVELPGVDCTLVIGDVVMYHVRDELWTGTQVDPEKLRPLARLGMNLYAGIGPIRGIDPRPI